MLNHPFLLARVNNARSNVTNIRILRTLRCFQKAIIHGGCGCDVSRSYLKEGRRLVAGAATKYEPCRVA